MPNAWDAGSARVLTALGFEALATTSSGHAATLGRLDGSVSRDEALQHASELAGATDTPVSADLENGYAHGPEGVAETVTLAREAGLAGCSIEDFTGDADHPIYDLDAAVARIDAAVGAAHAGPVRLVLTARAENHIHGRDDLDDTIARLQAYQESGADVLYALDLKTNTLTYGSTGAITLGGTYSSTGGGGAEGRSAGQIRPGGSSSILIACKISSG